MSPSLAIVKVWWSKRPSWPGSVNRADTIRSPSASPTEFEIPWPSGPVVTSMPGEYLRSGCPAVGDPTRRKCLMSSIVIG